MTIERIHNEFVVAPEFRVTDLDGETGQIVGVSGGRVFDSVLLVGAGGYWMVDASRGTDMGYGGLVVEWRQRSAKDRSPCRSCTGSSASSDRAVPEARGHSTAPQAPHVERRRRAHDVRIRS